MSVFLAVIFMFSVTCFAADCGVCHKKANANAPDATTQQIPDFSVNMNNQAASQATISGNTSMAIDQQPGNFFSTAIITLNPTTTNFHKAVLLKIVLASSERDAIRAATVKLIANLGVPLRIGQIYSLSGLNETRSATAKPANIGVPLRVASNSSGSADLCSPGSVNVANAKTANQEATPIFISNASGLQLNNLSGDHISLATSCT